jgi:tRNA(Ile)-lysidine synthase
LTQEAENLFNLAIRDDQNGLQSSIIKGKPLSLQRRVIKDFLAKKLKTMPNFEQIEAVVSLIDAPNRSRTSSLTKGMFAQVERDFITIISP